MAVKLSYYKIFHYMYSSGHVLNMSTQVDIYNGHKYMYVCQQINEYKITEIYTSAWWVKVFICRNISNNSNLMCLDEFLKHRCHADDDVCDDDYLLTVIFVELFFFNVAVGNFWIMMSFRFVYLWCVFNFVCQMNTGTCTPAVLVQFRLLTFSLWIFLYYLCCIVLFYWCSTRYSLIFFYIFCIVWFLSVIFDIYIWCVHLQYDLA